MAGVPFIQADEIAYCRCRLRSGGPVGGDFAGNSPSILRYQKWRNIFAYVSCMDTGYVREFSRPKNSKKYVNSDPEHQHPVKKNQLLGCPRKLVNG